MIRQSHVRFILYACVPKGNHVVFIGHDYPWCQGSQRRMGGAGVVPGLIPPCSPRQVTLSGGIVYPGGGKSTRDTFREDSGLGPARIIPERGLPDPFGGEPSAYVLLVFADPVERDPPCPAE